MIKSRPIKSLSLLLSWSLLLFTVPLHAEQLEPVEAAAIDAADTNTPVKTEAITFDKQHLIELLQAKARVVLEDPEGIYNFYKAKDFAVFWTDGTKISGKADKMMDIIDQSWQQGFNPDNYHIKELKTIKDQSQLADPVAFEILMSDAAARYGHDMTGMRVSARVIGEDTRSWRKGASTEEVLKYLSENDDPEKAFENLAPPSKLYLILQKELKGLLDDMKDHPDTNRKAIPFPGLIYPHKTHPVVKIVRDRFEIKTAKDSIPEFYDDKLIKRIQVFQKANGLKPDGIIGQRTIDAINQGRRDKLVKILANMERLRWMNTDLPDKYIIVNVPAMMLWAFESGKISFEMPVIVGKPDWPTNSFKTDITGIRFNPSWYVPPSIQTKDLLPELRKNPGALDKKNLQLLYYTSDGAKPVSPRDIDWNKMSDADMKNFAMIQNPGDENPLGKIRVLMPNQYNIYLHDTNSPDLFTKDFRALSHGCIRLSEPRKVASFILDKNATWNEDRLNAILAKKNTIEVAADSKVPVFILYQTIWQDGSDDIIFGQDIYKNDEKLVQELARKNMLPVAIN